jgi:hypothetical protein
VIGVYQRSEFRRFARQESVGSGLTTGLTGADRRQALAAVVSPASIASPVTTDGLPASRSGDCDVVLEKRKREIGENETNSREVNELVRPLDRELRTALCECGEAACREQLLIAHDDYARLREDPTLFVLRPGHEFAETEQVEVKHLGTASPQA